MSAHVASPPGTPIGWPLRAWFGVELFFAAAATSTVAVRPAETAASFAWTIRPEVMASLFGAFYVALAPVLVLALLARRWEGVRVFVLPGALFTATQLVVTFLHWDRFALWSGPFNLWFASYLLPPPVFLGCYWWQERQARQAATPVGAGGRGRVEGAPLAGWLRAVLLALGAVVTVEAVVGLVAPSYFASWAPWKVTPLNARALGGYLLLLGLLLLSAARENDRHRARIVAPFLVLLLPTVTFQVRRFADQVDWSHPRVWITASLLATVAGVGLALLRGDWRRTLGWR